MSFPRGKRELAPEALVKDRIAIAESPHKAFYSEDNERCEGRGRKAYGKKRREKSGKAIFFLAFLRSLSSLRTFAVIMPCV